LLNSNEEVIYIGEAVTIGKRFGDYFRYDENNNNDCMIKDVSKKDSKYVVSFALT
jgi:excinuclease UvrABC nuclease subunit